MNNAVKGFLAGVAAVALIMTPACKTNKTKVKDDHVVVAPDTAPPTVTIPPNDTATRVQPSEDFVHNDTAPVTTETLPTDTEELNR